VLTLASESDRWKRGSKGLGGCERGMEEKRSGGALGPFWGPTCDGDGVDQNERRVSNEEELKEWRWGGKTESLKSSKRI